MPRPYGRVCSHLQCDRLSLGLTLKNRRVNCTFTGKPIIRPTANCSAFDVSTLTRHFVFTLYCSHQTVPCSVLRRVDPKSPLHIHSTLFTPVVRPTVPCSELRRSEDWPSQHIRVVVGRCIRTNTIICKHPLCLGTPIIPFITHNIAQYSVSPRQSFIQIHAIYTTGNGTVVLPDGRGHLGRRPPALSPLHDMCTPAVRPIVSCFALRRSVDWPSHHIRFVLGRCIRSNTIISKHPPCLRGKG